MTEIAWGSRLGRGEGIGGEIRTIQEVGVVTVVRGTVVVDSFFIVRDSVRGGNAALRGGESVCGEQ